MNWNPPKSLNSADRARPLPLASPAPVAPTQISIRDLSIAACLMVVWASNFPVGALGLQQVPPFTLATLRFLFAAFPMIVLVKKPAVSWIKLATFGMFFGIGQFGLLFLGIRVGVPAGLASLIVQMQVFFTMLLAAVMFSERLKLYNLVALIIAGSGLVIIGIKGGHSAPLEGVLLVLLSALSWAICNSLGRSVDRRDMLGFICWASAFAVPPLLVATALLEGLQSLTQTLLAPSVSMIGIVAWQSFANSLWGYTVWNRLLGRYSAVQVAPLTLPVPIIAGLLSNLILGDTIYSWEIEACILVLTGLAVNMIGARLATKKVAAI